MTGDDVIREVKENASEWLEMAENPAELMAGILANRVAHLSSYIEFLERRLDHDSRQKARVN